MRVVTLRDFNDLKCGVLRKAGETFVVSKGRYEEICAVRDDLVAPADDAKPKGRRRTNSNATE